MPPTPFFRALAVGAAIACQPLVVAAQDFASWAEVEEAARGQTVHFNAWGGSPEINAYIESVGDRLEDEAGVRLDHVRITDAAEAVARIVAEKAAGRDDGGSIDLLWINGENFAALKRAGLLYGPFVALLPNAALLDLEGDAALTHDFTVPTEGFESPWGRARFVLIHDEAETPEPPMSAAALLAHAEAHPGRVTYASPPDFTGTTFLKQILIELAPDPSALQSPPDDATFDQTTAPLWEWLDRLHESAWRSGGAFPQNNAALHQLFEDGEVDLTMAFNPAEASTLVIAGRAPETTRAYAPAMGSIGNAHFVAIPYNAEDKAGALMVANALLSVEAQVEKAEPAIWGDGAVLDFARLSAEERALFDAIERHPATPAPDALGPTLPEPHPEWMTRIEEVWRARYAAG